MRYLGMGVFRSAGVLSLLLILSIAGSAHAGTAKSCERPGMRVVVASVRSNVVFDRAAPNGGRYLACLYSTGRMIEIAHGVRPARGRDFPLVSLLPRLAGNFVAVDQGTAGVRAIKRRTVRVVNLRTGTTLHQFSQSGSIIVTDLEVKANGSVAWIWREADTGPSVHKFDSRHVELYRGALSLRSLALSESTLFWDTGAGPMSARLD